MLARIDGEPAMIRVGSRLPTASDKGTQYTDVGLNLDVTQLAEVSGKLAGFLSLEMTSVAPAERSDAPAANPVLRHLRFRGPFDVVAGKSMVVGTIDDVNSTHQFQVELTATRQ